MGTERAAHHRPTKRKDALAVIEALREKTWRDKSIKTFSPEWHAVCRQLRDMRKALKRKR